MTESTKEQVHQELSPPLESEAIDMKNLRVEFNPELADKLVPLYDTEKSLKLLEGIQWINASIYFTIQKKSEEDKTIPLDLTIPDRLSCSFCNIIFPSRDEQKLHFKLDWHRFNLKQNLAGKCCVSEIAFEKHLKEEELNSSLPAQELEVPDENETSDIIDNEADDDEVPEVESGATNLIRNNKLFFKNANDQLLSLYRNVIYNKKNSPESQSDIIKIVSELPNHMTWAILMVGGGHFAGALFKNEKIICQKTFHRYVVRAKQGTRQSSRDGHNCGHKPKSPGATLRRYNELALSQEIQALLELWKPNLDQCDLIFIRVPPSNKKLIFSSKNILQKQDPRIRTIPFATNRPKFKELLRVYNLLSTIELLDQEDFESWYRTPKLSPKRKPSPKKLKAKKSEQTSISVEKSDTDSSSSSEYELESTEVELSTLDLKEFDCDKDVLSKMHSHPKKKNLCEKKTPAEKRLLDCLYSFCKSGDINRLEQLLQPLLPVRDEENFVYNPENEIEELRLSPSKNDEKIQNKKYIEKNIISQFNLDPNFSVTESLLNKTFGVNGQTLLHVSAEEGQYDVISILLEAGADPALRNKKHQTSYEVASNKNTRNEFRRFMACHPDKYDYEKAQIPSPLSDEMEKIRAIKVAEKRKEKTKKKKEKMKEAKVKKTEDDEKRHFLNLSDREKRALAAERRFVTQVTESGKSRPVLSRCFQCACDITGKIPFEYCDYKFCSMNCLKQHKQQKK